MLKYYTYSRIAMFIVMDILFEGGGKLCGYISGSSFLDYLIGDA